jgi:amidophosphoribosyltransferase
MPAAHELIAHNRSEQEICKVMGADRMIYQDLDDLIDAVRKGNSEIKGFDTSCFSNEYITGDIDNAYLEKIEALRNDNAQTTRKVENSIIEMQNSA